MRLLTRLNPFKGRQLGTHPAKVQLNTQQAGPNTGPLASSPGGHAGTPGLQQVQGGQLNLVNYSPEELLQHVEHTLSSVHFGMSRSTRFMETAAQLWAVAVPAVLLAGTAGEV